MHYNIDALRRSLRHFLVGKTASALSSVLLLILLARWLDKADYALYVSLQALLVIVTYVTSLGINQSLLRYIPELRAANNNFPMYRMVRRALFGRAAAIGMGFLVVWAILPSLGEWLNLAHWQVWIPVYLLVGWARLFNQFVSRIMESLLWQKQSQYSLAFSNVLRLALVTLLAFQGTLDIPALFLVELVSELITVALLLGAYLSMWHNDAQRHVGDPDWWYTHRQRANLYALWAYLASLAAMLATSAPYRLVAARLLAPEAVALYGFASSVADMINRYTPTRLMQGTIRTVLVARHSKSGDQADLLAKLSLNYRFNALMLSVLAAFTLAGGQPILSWLTNDKYGHAAWLLAALLGVLMLDVLRAQLELLAEVCERNQWALAGNVIMILAVVLAFVLTTHIGLQGLILANGIGEIGAVAVMMLGMGRQGAARVFEPARVLPLFVLPAIGWGMSQIPLVTSIAVPLAVAGTALASAVLLMAWPPLSTAERYMLFRSLKENRSSSDQYSSNKVDTREASVPDATPQAKTSRAVRMLIAVGGRKARPRVDISDLFCKRLAAHNYRFEWHLQTDARGPALQRTEWFGQPALLSNRSTRSGALGAAFTKVRELLADVLFFRSALRGSFDIIQVRDKFLAGGLGLFAARLRGIPFVFWLSYPFPEARMLDAREGRSRHPWFSFSAGWLSGLLLYRVILPGASHVFVQSEQMKRDLLRPGLDPSRFTPVPMGIPDEDLPDLDAESASAPLLLYVGTLIRVRRLDALVRAFAQVVRTMPEARLVFVGEGDIPEDRAALEAEVDRLGLRDHVEFTGQLPRDQALQWIRRARACLSPFYPTFVLRSTSPTKLIEYMAFGKATLVNDHPEQAEVIAESKAGCCVAWNEDAFAKAMLQMLRDDKTTSDMGRRGRAWVLRHRVYSQISEKVHSQYQRIVSQTP
jgi:glycosyltransferase involved in cell wall biosynthesis/O-antigen/teichoic acid export membrane protein